MASEAFQQLIAQMRAARDAAAAGPPYDPVAMRPGMSQAMHPVPEGVTVTPVSANGVPSEWIAAGDASPANRLLYLHGGGYVGGGLDSHRHFSAALSLASGCTVLAADYRLAPEHPHPAPSRTPSPPTSSSARAARVLPAPRAASSSAATPRVVGLRSRPCSRSRSRASPCPTRPSPSPPGRTSPLPAQP